MKTICIIIIIIVNLIYYISTEKTKKFIIKRFIPDSNNTFYPYNFVNSDIISGGTYVFDTSSFYTWKKDASSIEPEKENIISINNKYNENVTGLINEDNNFKYISLQKDSSSYSGSICIPIKIPQRVENQMGASEDSIFNFLDLINNDIDQKYINYVQDSPSTGYVLFGEKDEIFNKNKNKRDVKTCNCIHPPDNDIQNEFLNYWNCKIISFSVDNIKNSSFYSINGDIYAIFALAEEYIIAPNKTGIEIINYYRKIIDDDFGKKCEMENFNKKNISKMVCETFNYAELPDFTITLDGEISLNALSFDLFKKMEDNDTHIVFKILLNELDTKEYWVIGDPIIKNYNFLFDYNKPNGENITIVASDKYSPFYMIVTCCVTSSITFIYFGFLLFARIKINILSKNKKKKQSPIVQRRTKKIKKIIRNQNDFEIPEGNIPILNDMRNDSIINDSDDEVKLDCDDEYSINNTEKENSSDMSGNSSKNIKNINSISKSIGNEKDLENKIKRLNNKNNKDDKNASNMYELNDLSNMNFSDEADVDDEEAILPPFSKI